MEAVRQVRVGQTIAVVAKVFGIPKASLGNWVRQSAKGDLSGAGPVDRAANVSLEQMELARCSPSTTSWRPPRTSLAAEVEQQERDDQQSRIDEISSQNTKLD